MNAATRSALAAAVRDACASAAAEAYEEAGVQGLCAEGRFEAAIGAIERVDLAALVPGPAAPASASAPPAPGNGTTLRRATRDDLPAIVAMLADDALGAGRERPGLPLAAGYLAAFEAIDRDPRCELLVACRDGRVVGTMQIDYAPGLSWQGAWQATISAVRVASAERSRGIGRAMLEQGIARARARGCRVVQLSADRSRHDAHRFYERLGFVASHLGMKRVLRP